MYARSQRDAAAALGRLGWLSRSYVAQSNGLAAVAQLVEHFLGKEEVMGSSPISSSLDRCVVRA